LVNGRQLWTKLLIVRLAKPAAKRGLSLDMGHKLREKLVRACCLDDEDVFCGVLLPLLWRGPSGHVVAAVPGLVGLGSPNAAAGVPLTKDAEVWHRC
jgi:hypothetical protein